MLCVSSSNLSRTRTELKDKARVLSQNSQEKRGYSQARNRNVGDRRIRRPSGKKLEAKMPRKTAIKDNETTTISCSRRL